MIILLHLKILKIRSFLVGESFSRAIFWKLLLPTTNQHTANDRSISSLTETVLILKIGQREPLSFQFENFVVEVAFKNGALWASELLSSAQPWITMQPVKLNSAHRWNPFACKIILNYRLSQIITASIDQQAVRDREPALFRANWIPDCPAICMRSGADDQFQSRDSTSIKSSIVTVILK